MEPRKIEKLLADGHITEAESTQMSEDWQRQQVKVGAELDEETMQVMDESNDPDLFLAKVILRVKDCTLSERRRICRAEAHMAELQGQLCETSGLRFLTRRWSKVAWGLRSRR